MSPTRQIPRQSPVRAQSDWYSFHSLAERPEFRAQLRALDAVAFPAFMEESDLAPLWPTIYDQYADWQLVACDPLTGRHMAHANAVPFSWDGAITSLPQAAVELVTCAMEHKRDGRRPNALGALQVVVEPARQGHGLSTHLLQAVGSLAAARGVIDLFAPIRPNRKACYPLTPFASYVQNTLGDGLPADPWQRVHARLGAKPVGIAAEWLTVVAPVYQWEHWSAMCFAVTGSHVVPGALTPVAIDMERGIGRYAEPHLWMRHQLTPDERAHR